MICNTHYGYCGAGGGDLSKLFTYTGNFNVRDDGVIELLTSGTITFKRTVNIDVFLVGGGASGAMYTSGSTLSRISGGGGGGGGYTLTVKNKQVAGSGAVIIGSGGVAPNNSGAKQTPGESTTFFDVTAGGGKTGRYNKADAGSDGGSAGGCSFSGTDLTTVQTGASNGESRSTAQYAIYGQGSTTREFAENTGKLYSGGGGGGYRGTDSRRNQGGEGGGGAGAIGQFDNPTSHRAAMAGAPNTGGGGGGGLTVSPSNFLPGNGGSGIVCIRLAK